MAGMAEVEVAAEARRKYEAVAAAFALDDETRARNWSLLADLGLPVDDCFAVFLAMSGVLEMAMHGCAAATQAATMATARAELAAANAEDAAAAIAGSRAAVVAAADEIRMLGTKTDADRLAAAVAALLPLPPPPGLTKDDLRKVRAWVWHGRAIPAPDDIAAAVAASTAKPRNPAMPLIAAATAGWSSIVAAAAFGFVGLVYPTLHPYMVPFIIRAAVAAVVLSAGAWLTGKWWLRRRG